MSSACIGEPFFGEYEGKHYCVLHFPDADKKEAFDAAMEKKQKANDFNYQGVWFPTGYWFIKLEIPTSANFSYAILNQVAFHKTIFRKDVHFNYATLKGVSFDSAVFVGSAHFDHTIFTDHARFDYASFNQKSDFSEAVFQGQASFRRTKFEGDANFWRCVFVKRVDFDEAVFNAHASFWPTRFGSTANFHAAKFAGASFGGSRFTDDVFFQSASFGGASFVGVEFSKQANFFSATFDGKAYFTSSSFKAMTQFQLATFCGETLFLSATFLGETDFRNVTFKDYIKFSGESGRGGFGDCASCNFEHARFEKPERVSFHTITIRPHWFLNIDPRRFELVDVKWFANLNRDLIAGEIQLLKERAKLEDEKRLELKDERRTNAEMFSDNFELEELAKEEAEEIRDNPAKRKESLYRLLSITCRHLAVNAEENHRYDEASDFRFWSMELKRKEGWGARGRLSVIILHSLYRHLSGYGEEIGRALGILLGIWLIFAFLYTQVGFISPPSLSTESEPRVYIADEVGNPLKPVKALGYSLAVMTLQRPDPRPLTSAASFTILAETILGPIQAALFALAVRRRFIR